MSSRQNRADKSALGPEDFMDEEVSQAVTVSSFVMPSLSPESRVDFPSCLRPHLLAVMVASWVPVSGFSITQMSMQGTLGQFLNSGMSCKGHL